MDFGATFPTFFSNHGEQNQDVKAENVVLHGERAVLIDFGIASWRKMRKLPRPLWPMFFNGKAQDDGCQMWICLLNLYSNINIYVYMCMYVCNVM